MPRREFLYVDDMAQASLFVHNLDAIVFSENTKPMLSHVNIGTGTDVMIKELAETVKEIVGFSGKLVFDHTKPDGTPKTFGCNFTFKSWVECADRFGSRLNECLSRFHKK